MIENRIDRYPAWMRGAGRLGWLVIFAIAIGCAGGIPSIPNSPQGILERGDAYFARKMYFHSQGMYKAFLQRYPGDDQSDYAQFKLAESLYNGKEYGLAAVEYHLMVNNYGYSEYVDDAYYKEALCFYHQGLKPRLDQSKREDALERLERFVTVFPQSDLVPDAQEHIRLIHKKLAEKAFANARFYDKNKRYRSAIIYYDKIIDKYPNNRYWPLALYFKGVILLRRGENDEAIRLFSKVLNYPEEVGVKRDAKREMERLRKQINE